MHRFVHPAFHLLNSSREVIGLVWELNLQQVCNYVASVVVQRFLLHSSTTVRQMCPSGGVLRIGIGVILADS